MAPIERAESVTQGMIDALGKNERRFEENGIDFEVELDNWAKEYDEGFSELGITYPADGSIPEKIQALIPIFVVNRLRGHIVQLDAQLDRLERSGERLSEDEAGDLAVLTQQLNKEGAERSDYKHLIAELRGRIDRLRAKI